MGQRRNESRKFQIKLGEGPAFKAQLVKPTHTLDQILSFPSFPASLERESITYQWLKYDGPLVKSGHHLPL